MTALVWQDVVIAIGTFVGLASKAYALADPRTTWSRWASIPNALLYSGSVVAFATLGLWLTAGLAACSMALWFGIGIWRPATEEAHD